MAEMFLSWLRQVVWNAAVEKIVKSLSHVTSISCYKLGSGNHTNASILLMKSEKL